MNKTIKNGLIAATCLFTLPLFAPLSAQEIETNITTGSAISVKSIGSSLKKAASNFTFDYYVKYLGPGLSGNMQQGSTYNRFNTGQSWDGSEEDFRSSEQIYQSFKLGFRLPRNMIVSYSVTYQDDVKKDIEYDGGTRRYGRSYNDQRLSLWVPDIYSNSLVYLHTSLFYERATTDSSIEKGMQYGVGVQPTLGFYTGVPGLSTGISASIERDVYPDNEFMPDWCKEPGYSCDGVETTKRQTTFIGLSPYVNYSLTDSLTLQAQLAFDWDQDGDQAETLEFNNNMNDTWALGANYRAMKNVSIGFGVEGSLSEPHLDRTAMFGSLGVSI